MKSIKLILIFSVVVFAAIGVMFVLDFINQDQALNYGIKGFALVFILGFALLAITKIAGRSTEASSSQSSAKPGPKF